MNDDHVPIVRGTITAPTTLMLGRYFSVELSPLEKAIKDVCGIGPGELWGKRRFEQIVDARNIAFWIMHKHFGFGATYIGHKTNRNHTSIHYAIIRAGEMIEVDPKFRTKVEAVKMQLGIA